MQMRKILVIFHKYSRSHVLPLSYHCCNAFKRLPRCLVRAEWFSETIQTNKRCQCHHRGRSLLFQTANRRYGLSPMAVLLVSLVLGKVLTCRWYRVSCVRSCSCWCWCCGQRAVNLEDVVASKTLGGFPAYPRPSDG